MGDCEKYAFLDCGNGRRLEQIGRITVVRPAKGANASPKLNQAQWKADAIFTDLDGWTGTIPDPWIVQVGPARLRLVPGAQGRIGFFPEHVANCRVLEKALSGERKEGWRVLNVFAHTGLATLWAASLPCVGETVHVDGSKGAVRRARENAELSGLSEKRIRWIVDDAKKFMTREARRESRYDAILLDPPAFGRGPKGEQWEMSRDIDEIISLSTTILSKSARLILLSTHATGISSLDIRHILRPYLSPEWKLEVLSLELSGPGAPLSVGFSGIGRQAQSIS